MIGRQKSRNRLSGVDYLFLRCGRRISIRVCYPGVSFQATRKYPHAGETGVRLQVGFKERRIKERRRMPHVIVKMWPGGQKTKRYVSRNK